MDSIQIGESLIELQPLWGSYSVMERQYKQVPRYYRVDSRAGALQKVVMSMKSLNEHLEGREVTWVALMEEAL